MLHCPVSLDTHGKPVAYNSAAIVLACSVNVPEIRTCPLNEDQADWVGWVIGAEMTWPLSATPMIW